MSKPEHQIAMLMHLVKWENDATSFELGPGVSLVSLKDHPVCQLYEQMCADSGLDDGEPFLYDTAVLFSPNIINEHFLDLSDPYSAGARICNLVAVSTRTLIGMCRVIYSNDEFRSTTHSREVYFAYGQTNDFLSSVESSGLTRQHLADIKRMWNNTNELWRDEKAQGRLINALVYFYYAWRSHYLDQACINLAIVVEILFAPHEFGETTHQLSFNASRFLAELPEDRERIYRSIKRFYSARSSIIHGGVPPDHKYMDQTVEAFGLVAEILHRVLVDEQLARKFNNNKSRQELLVELLFN